MSQGDIQAFLNSSPVLAAFQDTDYPTGKKALASTIIYDAAQKFHINPRVILALLQKEQSLLTRSKSSLITKGHVTTDWALGMGCPDALFVETSCMRSGCHTSTPPDNRYPEYRGFGKQIWAGCVSLDAYGEKGKTRPGWHHTPTPASSRAGRSGTTMTIGGVKLKSPEPRHIQALHVQPQHRREVSRTATCPRRRATSRATRTSGGSTASTSATPSRTRRSSRSTGFGTEQRQLPVHAVADRAVQPRRIWSVEVSEGGLLLGHFGHSEQHAGYAVLQPQDRSSTSFTASAR